MSEDHFASSIEPELSILSNGIRVIPNVSIYFETFATRTPRALKKNLICYRVSIRKCEGSIGLFDLKTNFLLTLRLRFVADRNQTNSNSSHISFHLDFLIPAPRLPSSGSCSFLWFRSGTLSAPSWDGPAPSPNTIKLYNGSVDRIRSDSKEKLGKNCLNDLN